MSIYVICPRYLEYSANGQYGDLANAIYRHFLPRTKCRIGIDDKNFSLHRLEEHANDHEAIKHMLDTVVEQGISDQVFEEIDVPEGTSDYQEAVEKMADSLGELGRVLCYSVMNYRHLINIKRVDRAQVSEFMEQDCGESKNMTNYYITGNTNSAVAIGDANSINVAVGSIDASKTNFEQFQRDTLSAEIEKSLISARNGNAAQNVLSEIEELKKSLSEKNDKSFVEKIRGLAEATKPWVSAIVALVALFAG